MADRELKLRRVDGDMYVNVKDLKEMVEGLNLEVFATPEKVQNFVTSWLARFEQVGEQTKKQDIDRAQINIQRGRRQG